VAPQIAIIKVAQRAGILLAAIQKALASLPNDRVAWKLELDIRIRKLTQLQDQLGDCIGCGCLSIKACPLQNPLDELASQGSRPQLLEQA
jgi:MerR family redox-sensitive transcriptional activator SoxR